MENQSGWYLPSQYLTKRWQQTHQIPSSVAANDKTAVTLNTRYGRVGRNQSSAGLSNKSSFSKYKIQELCFDNKKLLIFDQSSEVKEDMMRPHKNTVSFRELKNSATNKSYLPAMNSLKKSHFASRQDFRDKFYSKKEQPNGEEKSVRDQDKFLSPKMSNYHSKENIKAVNFATKKSNNVARLRSCLRQTEGSPLKVTINTEQVKQSPNKSPLMTKRSAKESNLKSSRSLRAPQSHSKSKQSNSSFSSKNYSISPQKNDEIKEVVKTENGDYCFPQISQAASKIITHNPLHLLAQLLDPIQLLSPVYQMRPIMSDPYEDFDQWGHYALPQPPVLNDSRLFPSSYGPFESSNLFQRKGLLPTEFNSGELELSKNDEKPMNRSRESNPNQNKSYQTKRWCSMVLLTNTPQPVQKKERCMTTKATDKNQDSRRDQFRQMQMFQTEMIPQNSGTNQVQAGPGKQDRIQLDNEFNIKALFQSEQKINYVEIKLTNQTSFFPSNFKTPAYVIPNPVSLCSYRNTEIIKLVNLFLKVQPNVIRDLFRVQDKNLYQCRLYEGGHKKQVKVDGVFPFDSHFYPLVGSVEQYIWFAVLVKAIAKLKGSYKAVSKIDFRQMFTLLTKMNLYEANQQIICSQNPSNKLSELFKQSKKQDSFILVVQDETFYKIQKISCVKSSTQLKEEKELQRTSKITRLRKSQRESNMKSLVFFIKQQKDQISLQRMKERTRIKLVNSTQSKIMAFGQLMSSNYLIWMPKAETVYLSS